LTAPNAAHEVVDRLFREEQGRAVATLIRVTGDFDLAEEAVQDAFISALETWPQRGVPDNPGAWITTTARNRAIDRLRRRKRLVEKTETLAREASIESALATFDPRRRRTICPSRMTDCASSSRAAIRRSRWTPGSHSRSGPSAA
jgi:Predicted RNA polymerase sigma factor containing a TPR repeat domain